MLLKDNTPLGMFPFLRLYLATLRIGLHSEKQTNVYRIPDTLPATGDIQIKKDDRSAPQHFKSFLFPGSVVGPLSLWHPLANSHSPLFLATGTQP